MELTRQSRDIQAICGRGCSAGYTCGSQTLNGKNINAWGNRTVTGVTSNASVTLCLVFRTSWLVTTNGWPTRCDECFIVQADWKSKSVRPKTPPIRLIPASRIYDVVTDTERSVQATPQGAGYCHQSCLRHGRYMDVVPGKTSSDNSALGIRITPTSGSILMVGAVLSVVLSNNAGMRMAVSFMRTRTSFLRSRSRSTALGSPSVAKSSLMTMRNSRRRD